MKRDLTRHFNFRPFAVGCLALAASQSSAPAAVFAQNQLLIESTSHPLVFSCPIMAAASASSGLASSQARTSRRAKKHVSITLASLSFGNVAADDSYVYTKRYNKYKEDRAGDLVRSVKKMMDHHPFIIRDFSDMGVHKFWILHTESSRRPAKLKSC